MVYGPRIGFASALIVGITLLGLSLSLAWAIEVPRLAQPSPAPDMLANSTPGATRPLVRLTDRLDPLPIVVQDLPDAASRKAAAEYASLRVTEDAPAITMFTDAWSALDVPAASASDVHAYSDQLLNGGFPDSGFPAPDVQSTFDDAVGPIVAELASDPRNGDRLANVAVALFAIGVIRNNSPFAPEDQQFLVRRARLLLGLTADRFPASRAAHLDLAFVTSLDHPECSDTADPELGQALQTGDAWLQSHPDDVTARMLVGSLASRRVLTITAAPPTDDVQRTVGLGDALRALDPLRASSATAALGAAGSGDAYLAVAMAVRSETPWLARNDAQRALQAYGRALAMALDPGLLAGESRALSLLGDNAGALAAQRRAVALAPDSPELLLGLAADREGTGDIRGMQASAEQGLSISVATGQDALPLRDARLIMQSPLLGLTGLVPGDLGYLGYSIGSQRPRVNVPESSSQCGAGGYVITTRVIPQVDDTTLADRVRWDPLSAAALTLALAASTVLGDSTSADADLGRWMQTLAGRPVASVTGRWTNLVSVLAASTVTPSLISGRQDPRQLVGATTPEGGPVDLLAFRFGEGWLRQAASVTGEPRLFGRAEQFCSGMAAADPGLQMEAEQCAGESGFYAADKAKAAATLQGLYQREVDTGDYTSAGAAPLGVEAGLAFWLGGGTPTQAEPLFRQATTADDGPDAPIPYETRATGYALLGELLLDQGQVAAATGDLQEAVRLARTDASPPPGQSTSAGVDARVIDRQIIHDAANDVGVSLLSSLQSRPEAAPDCIRQRATCDAARGDFAQALAIDPYDPVALQNIGWVDRLEGHLGAARAELSRAVQSNPGQYPALNDLGWLAATSGDAASARSALAEALRIAPEDDLAAWDLGVLTLSSGPLGIPAGEAYLARAIRVDPELREQPLAYRTDERIYRQTYGTTIEPVTTRWLDTRFGGGVLATGALGATSALLSVSGLNVEDQLTELLSDPELPLVGGLMARIRRRARKASPGRAWRLARSAAGWLVTLGAPAALTVWTAWPASPIARASVVTLAVVATGLALLVHESAHVVAACLARIRIRAVWPGRTTLLSVALLPFGASDGPFPGHQALPGTAFRRARWVYLAGPLANLLVAAGFYALFRFEALPALRLLAEVQLGAAAFSVLPIRPLDASAFQRHRADALLLIPIALLAAVGGYAFRAGLV